VASASPLEYSRVIAMFAGQGNAGTDLQELGRASVDDLIAGFVLSPENLDRFVGDIGLNTDDSPRIELDAPRAAFEEDHALPNLRALLAASSGARIPIAATATADGTYRAQRFEAVPPAGFHLAFSGLRIEAGTATDAPGLP